MKKTSSILNLTLPQWAVDYLLKRNDDTSPEQAELVNKWKKDLMTEHSAQMVAVVEVGKAPYHHNSPCLGEAGMAVDCEVMLK